ncbi:MAG: hypothetical protein HY554_08730 [Elusimicrobia bacterium]|nr:hypothetical protein [Elusimicrobiota bacterium]
MRMGSETDRWVLPRGVWPGLLCAAGLIQAAPPPARAQPQAEAVVRPLARSYFVFVRGCLSESGPQDGKPPCTGPGDWGEYAVLLREIYDVSRAPGEPDFQLWSRSHRHDISARRADEAADRIKTLIDDPRLIPPGGAVHFPGHSAGGAGVMEYLLREAIRGTYACGSRDGCANRIASVTTVDSPLGFWDRL